MRSSLLRRPRESAEEPGSRARRGCRHRPAAVTFLPAQHQGKPVKVYYTLTTNFTIEKDPGKS